MRKVVATPAEKTTPTKSEAFVSARVCVWVFLSFFLNSKFIFKRKIGFLLYFDTGNLIKVNLISCKCVEYGANYFQWSSGVALARTFSGCLRRACVKRWQRDGQNDNLHLVCNLFGVAFLCFLSSSFSLRPMTFCLFFSLPCTRKSTKLQQR